MLWMCLLLNPNCVWLIIDSRGLNSSVPVGEVCANDQANAASIGLVWGSRQETMGFSHDMNIAVFGSVNVPLNQPIKGVSFAPMHLNQ